MKVIKRFFENGINIFGANKIGQFLLSSKYFFIKDNF